MRSEIRLISPKLVQFLCAVNCRYFTMGGTAGRPSEFFGPGATELQLSTLLFVVLNECLDADYGDIICF